MIINSFSVSAYGGESDILSADGMFTLTINITNNAGFHARSYSVYGMVKIPYTDADGSAAVWPLTIASFPVGFSGDDGSINLPNGASHTFTFTEAINSSAKSTLESIYRIDPTANIRLNDIEWSVWLYNADASAHDTAAFNGGILLYKCWLPTIGFFNIERSIDGVPNDEGISILTTMWLAFSQKAPADAFTLALHYSDSGMATPESPFIDLTAHIPDMLSGVTDSPDLITQTFANTSNWNFLLVFGDEYESASAAVSISRAFANMHLSGKTTGGVAFGGFSTSEEGNPKAEFHYRIYPYAGIEGLGITYPKPNETWGDPATGEEQLTGDYWVDGKPIYRRTAEGYIGVTGTDVHFQTIPRVDTLVKLYGYANFYNNGANQMPINMNVASSWRANVFMSDYQNDYTAVVGNCHPAALVKVIIEFTKESDPATIT